MVRYVHDAAEKAARGKVDEELVVQKDVNTKQADHHRGSVRRMRSTIQGSLEVHIGELVAVQQVLKGPTEEKIAVEFPSRPSYDEEVTEGQCHCL